ncbi:PREDICTED: uncharacterized protein LOC108745339 [Trachymyrmex septentrionalis]|uniref:uncharacterized protein LOC108745339 n=1 Tax=Trachymyrmex septentrionalis TaxID=34720 RepID=UPI00084F7254|nr:PREDICTED: uncharacterized protein LOC108745339 [Trachymyrmex septentrionalis]
MVVSNFWFQISFKTYSKENENLAANSVNLTIKKKTVKRTRQTIMSIIGVVRRNQCFYDLAQSKAELVLIKEDLRAKFEIGIQILNTQLGKKQLEIKLLRKQIQLFDK